MRYPASSYVSVSSQVQKVFITFRRDLDGRSGSVQWRKENVLLLTNTPVHLGEWTMASHSVLSLPYAISNAMLNPHI
jgi:hypothetical protein